MINLRNICFYVMMVYGAPKSKMIGESIQSTQIKTQPLPAESSPKPPSILEEARQFTEEVTDLEMQIIQATQDPKDLKTNSIFYELISKNRNFAWAGKYQELLECGFSTIICISTTLIAVTTIARFILELRNGTYLQPKP